MFRHFKILGLAWATFFLPVAGQIWAVELSGDAARIGKYIKVTDRPEGDHLARLETSVVKFRSVNNPNLEVDLVGVIHLGDAPYYKAIEAHLEQYDAVLYEWIGPKGTVPHKEFYRKMAEAMDLVNQTGVINYKRSNFVHADMTQEQFLEALGLKDFRPPVEEEDPFEAEFALTLKAKGAVKARWELARALSEDTRILDQPVIILERNRVALKVLETQINAGKRKIAIFYGAAHMPDFEQHMLERYGLRPVRTTWFTAWDLDRDR